jgi:hypothetical protein
MGVLMIICRKRVPATIPIVGESGASNRAKLMYGSERGAMEMA